jgi:NAD(P)-dependent dehydrogenase (short-subunit alcohol dehydrogenase family)
VAFKRVAVVTRGAGAIGSAIGDALEADGPRVVVVDRTGDVTADLSSENSARAGPPNLDGPHGKRCHVLGCRGFDAWVKGIEPLRVDASILPEEPSTVTNLTVIMIAERIFDRVYR